MLRSHLLLALAVLLVACEDELVVPDIDTLMKLENLGSEDLPSDGISTTTFRVVLDAATDTSIKEVEFTTTRGTFSGSTTYLANIRSDRTAEALLTAGREPGACTVTAKVATLTVAHNLAFVYAKPDLLQLDLSMYVTDTTSSAAITVTTLATRMIGQPSAGQTVWFSFAPDTASTGLVLPAAASIGSNGQATATLTNPFMHAGLYTISARMLGGSGDTLLSQRTLLFQ